MAKFALKCGDSYGKEKKGYLASSRIRGHWLANYWLDLDERFYPENFNQTSEEFFQVDNQLRILQGYTTVILQKTYEWRLAQRLRERGQLVIVDCCDPDWLSSHSSEQRKNDCLKTFDNADAVVVNGKYMAESVKKVFKGLVEIIPDRIDLKTCYPKKDYQKEEVRSVVWYGYSENLRVLEPYLKKIINLGLEITIISDKFFQNLILTGCKYNPKEKITFKVWHPETINQQIIEHDIVFTGKDLDQYLSKFKSNNRKLTAWALNMPVAENIKDLKRLLSREERIKDVFNGNKLVREKFDIRHSVYVYEHLINRLIYRRKDAHMS